ncbi:MAG: hypothetical protein ACKN81_17590 [Pirellulaceae bacterium]
MGVLSLEWPNGARQVKNTKASATVHANPATPSSKPFKIPLPKSAANRRRDAVAKA